MDSIQAICKNTFISFVVNDADESVPASLAASPRLAPRSRSAESFRCRPEADQFQELSQQSVQRLNAALSMGISSPSQGPETAFDTLDQNLQILQGRLAKALVELPNSAQKPWAAHRRTSSGHSLSTMASDDISETGDAFTGGGLKRMPKAFDKNLRNTSSCSISTMATTDDISECGEAVSNGLRRMPNVWSSNSLSSMASDFNGSFAEDDEDVEFELNVEDGGCAAALEAKVSSTNSTSQAQAHLEMSHSQVPRNQNMADMYNDSSKDLPPTTMMIRNMPGRYSQKDLMMDLQDLGFAGTYDFLYIPIDKRTAANVGYSFVNFTDHRWAERCSTLFQGYRFSQQKRSSNKLGSVSVAFLQGLEANLRHYEHAAVNMSRDKRRKPVVMPNIAQACR